MTSVTQPTLTLNDGVEIPQLGYGVWQVPEDAVTAAVRSALDVGYRHIDTAAVYRNEEGVGRAIAESGVPREEVFVTTKLWCADLDDARRAIETSLTKLGMDQLDLYLIHWPATPKYGDAFVRAWDALQEFRAEGLTRSIGVSNFNADHLDKLSGAIPSVNQIEWHPSFHRSDLRADLDRRGIVVEAWSPLGNQRSPSDLDLPEVQRVADETGLSPAQVIIRWHLELGHVVIPKSVTPSRITENFGALQHILTPAQVSSLSGLNRDNRLGNDPATSAW